MSRPFAGFKQTPKVKELLTEAQRKTKRTKTSLILDCLEVGLPKIIGTEKSTAKKI